MTWTLEEALPLIREIEAKCPEFGCHVALTGGVLYKEGPRKDLDLLFYRIRQFPQVDIDGLLHWLQESLHFGGMEGFGFCYKTTWMSKGVDIFFPEERGGTYDEEDPLDLKDDRVGLLD